MADDRLIVALDVSTMDAMKEIVTSLGDAVSFYKVGMELFYAEGEQTRRLLRSLTRAVASRRKTWKMSRPSFTRAATRYGAAALGWRWWIPS